MEIKRVIKLKCNMNNQAKKMDFPQNYEELIKKAQSFIPLEDSTKRYQFIEEKSNKEINSQEDFELLSKSNEKEKMIKFSLNIIDNDIKDDSSKKIEIPEIFSPIKADGESIDINMKFDGLDKKDFEKKEEENNEQDDKIKKDIQDLVRNKMKALEENIIQDIYQSIKTQMISNDKKNSDDIVHKGIMCNCCGVENIKGIRYKCLQCSNFNLCGICESKGEHDFNHILIKIRKPIDESSLLSKKNNEIKYKNGEYNYSINTSVIKFNETKFDNLSQRITLKNIGNESWENGYIFKCLPESQIKGKDFELSKLNKDGTADIDLIFQDFHKDLIPKVNEYFVYYQMFNNNSEAIGKITKFKIIFQS